MTMKTIRSTGAASNAAAAMLRLAVFATAATMSAMAAEVIFPDGVTNIASATDWGGTLPETTDAIKFGGTSSRTVTALADVEFAGLSFGTQSRTVTLDMRESVSGGSPRRIKMNGPAYVANAWQSKYILRGGFWDFGEKSVGIDLASKYNAMNGSSARIDGGAVVLCGSLFGQWGRASDVRTCPLYVDGEGTVVTTKVVQVAQYNGRNNRFEFTDGAKVVITGTSNGALSVGGGAAADSDSNGNTLRVAGGASLEKIGNGTSYIGSAGSNNRLSIENGGTVRLSGLTYFGHAEGAAGNKRMGNRIDVTGADSRLTCGAVYCGNADGVAASAGNSNNVATVSDGGSLSCARWYLNGHDNGIVVSNGTVTVSDGGITCQTSTNCYLRFQGAHPSFVSWDANSQSIYGGGFTLRYDLPEDGYDGSVAWLFVSSNYVYASSSFRVEVSGVEKMAKRMKRQGVDRETVNLAFFKKGYSGLTGAMVAEWNASLPKGAKLSLANNRLTLEVTTIKPTVMLVK